MTNINRSALVPFSAETMFELVNDCESYPEFLYGCKNATLICRDEKTLVGELEMGKAGINIKFRTKNYLYPFEKIDLILETGPFKKLEGQWHFKQLSETACKITLDLNFDLKSNIASMAVSGVFAQIANKMVDSFVQRAKDLYG